MRKIIVLSALSLTLASLTHAQDPVHWRYEMDKTAAGGKEVRIVATIEEGWHIYAQIQPPEAISQPTAITFNNNPLVQFTGPIKEKGKKEIYTDKTAGITQYQYADSVAYTRPIRLRGQVKTSVSGTITYQACTAEMCLPAKTIPFSISLP